MTKAELVAKLAEKTGITKTAASLYLDTFTEITVEAIHKEGRFSLPDFGIFEVVERPIKIARNPQTNEQITVPAHKAVKFKSAKSLKEAVN